ncbi:MAG TPA: DUF2178 domain-containing protein [Methanoregulaceae archaeon]|nr:DUF2178 domain-containing protein [Methanoregulaceae archaeon]
MKQNTFLILTGIVGLIEVGIFWLSVELAMPFLITGAFIAGIVLIYMARRSVTDRKEDERSVLINQKAGFRTLEVFWVIFFAVSLGGVVLGFSIPLHIPRWGEFGNITPSDFPRELPRNMPPDMPRNISPDLSPDGPHLGYFGLLQMILLCCMMFLYIGFRIYYARKYGDWDSDEE